MAQILVQCFTRFAADIPLTPLATRQKPRYTLLHIQLVVGPSPETGIILRAELFMPPVQFKTERVNGVCKS